MSYELISLINNPTMPAAFSSWERNGKPFGMITVNQEFYLVFERRPFTVMQMMKLTTEKSIPPTPLQYLYAASLFYRKSRNPHYRSARPIAVFCLEYAESTCAMRPRSFWERLIGAKSEPEPAEVFFTVFTAQRRFHEGKMPNNFSEISAFEFLFNQVCTEFLKPEEASGWQVVSFSKGPDCPEVA